MFLQEVIMPLKCQLIQKKLGPLKIQVALSVTPTQKIIQVWYASGIVVIFTDTSGQVNYIKIALITYALLI